MRARTGLVGLVILVLAAAAACDSSSPSRSGSPATTQAGHPAGHTATPTTTVVPADASPAQLRAQFEQLLGHHALLAVRLMHSVVAGAPDLRQAAEASLKENTQALTQLVAAAYDDAHSQRFDQLWQRTVLDLTAYAEALHAGDAAAKQSARDDLLADADAYGSWLDQASGGRVQPSAPSAVRTHVENLMKQADAYAARDYATAYRIERQAYENLFAAGVTMAKGSVAPKAAAALDAPPEQLRSAFAMLLGAHMELIIAAQRATFAGAPQFKAAAAQVNANSSALTKGMGAIVGPQKAAEFQSAWAEHVEGLLAYSTAVAGRDEAAKEAAKENLNGIAGRLALYLSDIVRNELPLEPLTQALGQHDTHLIDQVDAYAAKRYVEADQMEGDGYQQMLGVANTLVAAIQKTVKPQLPVGGSQTGFGGTAHAHR